MNGNSLELVKDFKYLGSWVDETTNDMKVRIALAWQALNGMRSIWKSQLSDRLKLNFFTATVESVFLYGCESWTLTKQLERKIDGTYTRMLRDVKQIHWSSHTPNSQVYGTMPKISTKIRARRLRFAGHCFRQTDLPVSKLVLWAPTHGVRASGRPQLSYPRHDLPRYRTQTRDRQVWRDIIYHVLAT